MRSRRSSATPLADTENILPLVNEELVSVIVRSFNRVPSLCNLLEALLGQDWPRFEVVVVEQSTQVPAPAARRLEELAADPRVRILHHPPLGGAAARNVGVQRSRGSVLLFIDDDDLPVGARWIRDHLRPLEDPRCLGASGRHVHSDEPAHRCSPLLEAITRTLSYDPIFKTSLTYVQHDRPRTPVQAIHGTNASLRRSAWERFGGWDEDTAIEDEVSFCFRAQRSMKFEEYFAYDPRPVILRHREVAGGLDKRRMSPGQYFGHYLDHVHRIIGRYHPVRVVALYPFYLILSFCLSLGFLFKNSRQHRGVAARLLASASLLLGFPVHVATALYRLGQPASSVGRVSAARQPATATTAAVPVPAEPT
jgi:GT2 family glycosyltransferase